MSNARVTMLRGYARRMTEVARMAAEMSAIKQKWEVKYRDGDFDEELKAAMTGDRLATLAAEMRAEAPEQAQGFAEDVSTGMGDTALPGSTPAAGSALGLAPAPQPLIDMASTEPVKWGKR